MISAGVAVEGHRHGLGLPGPGPGPYIPAVAAYAPPLPPQDWRKQEFLRPAPKHTNTTRYNGSSTQLNGTRLLTKYPPSGPVNLSQSSVPSVKDEPHTAASAEELASYYPRLYAPPPPAFTGIYPGPYAGLYSGPYTPLVRAATAAAAAAAGYVAPPPLSPLEHQYSPPASATSPHGPSATAGGVNVSSAAGQGTFVSPATTQFPSGVSGARKELARDRERERERERERDKRVVQGFKVPSGKEGSLKHRILTNTSPRKPPTKPHPLSTTSNNTITNNNTVLPGNFTKGSLIQLATGELRRVEDMRTEDFVLSAERSPELRLAESTVLRVCENQQTASAMITLTYNQNRTQVEFDASLEHPFFVYGQGWASCSPDRTLQYYGLKVHRLQVGDILVSLTPREPGAVSNTHTSYNSSVGITYDLSRVREGTVTTTATTTAMTARQVTRPSVSTAPACMSSMPPPASTGCSNLHVLDNSLSNSRKRRWSAPDQITDEHEQVAQAARRPKE